MHLKVALVACLFLLPNIIGFLVFTAWPVVASALLSFTSWDLLSPPQWVGLDNFVELLGFSKGPVGWEANDPYFWKYLWNTLFLLLNLPLTIMGALGLAILLNQKLAGRYFYRLIFFLPSILAGVAIFYLWRFIYNPDFGLFNAVLGIVGIEGPAWLTDPHWAKPALLIMQTWMSVGGTGMILYLAALQNVPKELYEAAEIDGANAIQRFWAVTWPGVSPVTFFIFTMGLINGFQAGFDAVYVMTQGGPYGATSTLSFYIYEKAYVAFEMGYASAIAWVLFIMILVVTLFNFKRNQGKVVF